MNSFDLFNRWHRRIWWVILFIPGIILLSIPSILAFYYPMPSILVAPCFGGLAGIAIGLSFGPQLLWILTRIFEPEVFEILRDD